MKAYVGKGLPRFTKRTLIAHIKRVDPENTEVKRWILRMRRAYKREHGKDATLTFDALDLIKAYQAIKSFGKRQQWGMSKIRSRDRIPCAHGVIEIFKEMLTPEVSYAIKRSLNLPSWEKREMTLGYNLRYGDEFDYNPSKIIAVLERARG